MELAYAVRFSNGAADEYNAPGHHHHLQITTSDRPGEKFSHQPGPVTQIDSDGLHLSVTRPGSDQTGETAKIMCGIAAGTLQSVRLEGRLSSPVGPMGPDDQWAVVVVGRDGNLQPDTSVKHYGATHLVRAGLILLSVGQAQNPQPLPSKERLTFAQAYPPIPLRGADQFEFRLSTEIKKSRGTSVLVTPGHTWLPRTWQRPSNVQMTMLGVGVAIAKQTGTVSVIVHELRVFTL
jgi:hypothetical protein